MIFIIAVLTGILLGLLIPYNLTTDTLPYVAVAIIAALDSVFGGLVANLNRKFNMNVFLMGLVSNAVLAIFLTYIGNILGISLNFAVIIVFGVRMFNNLTGIRRVVFDVYFEKRAREKQKGLLAIKERNEIFDEEPDDEEIEEEISDDAEEKDKVDENADISETEDEK